MKQVRHGSGKDGQRKGEGWTGTICHYALTGKHKVTRILTTGELIGPRRGGRMSVIRSV